MTDLGLPAIEPDGALRALHGPMQGYEGECRGTTGL